MTDRSETSHLAFVGAGSLGQAFSGLLAARGRTVMLLARPGSAERLLAAGQIRLRGAVTRDVGVARAPAPTGQVGIITHPGDLPSDLGLVFATKGQQLPDAIAAVRRVWPPRGDHCSWVAGIQNGLVKDDLLAGAFGAERVVRAATILSAQRTDDGTVVVSGLGATYLGELGDVASPRVVAVVETLRTAGIPAQAVDDVSSVLWSKALNAIGIFGVCVLARCSSTAMGRRPDLVRAYLALIKEAGVVARASGVVLGDYTGFPIRTYLDTPEEEILARFAANAARASGPESFPSMVQDLLAGRPLEADAIFADMVDRAARVDVSVPRIELVRDLVQGIDPGGMKP